MAKTSPPCSNIWAEMEQLRNCFPIDEILNSNIIGEDITPLDVLQNFMYGNFRCKSPEEQSKKDGQEGCSQQSKPATEIEPIKAILNMIEADVSPMEILQNMCSEQKSTSKQDGLKADSKDQKHEGQTNNDVEVDPLQAIFNILGGKTSPRSSKQNDSKCCSKENTCCDSKDSKSMNPDDSESCLKENICCDQKSTNPNKDDPESCCKNPKSNVLECCSSSDKLNVTEQCCGQSNEGTEINPLNAIGAKSNSQNVPETGSRSPKQDGSVCSSSDSDLNGLEKNCDTFKFEIDVKEFAPEELSVKVVGNSVVVEAKHDEKPDGSGFVSRQFTRRFPIPAGYDLDLIKSSLSTNGILKVQIPKEHVSMERIIPVIRTGSSAI